LLATRWKTCDAYRYESTTSLLAFGSLSANALRTAHAAAV
jgi:hypothetical protein